MRKTAERAFAVSAMGHAVLLLGVLQLSQWRPVQRGYPRTISAVLVSKGAMGAAQSAAGSSSAPAKAAPPASKKIEPPKRETPRPAVARERGDKKKPAVSANSSAATTKKKEGGQEKSASTGAFAGSSAAKSGDSRPGAGSGTGGVARVDGPDFPFPHYLALLQFRIENQWQPAYLGPGQFSATVHFVIAPNGKITSVELEQSSGNFSFDQAALRAVHNANPLPALPEGLSAETLGVYFDFVANW